MALQGNYQKAPLNSGICPVFHCGMPARNARLAPPHRSYETVHSLRYRYLGRGCGCLRNGQLATSVPSLDMRRYIVSFWDRAAYASRLAVSVVVIAVVVGFFF